MDLFSAVRLRQLVSTLLVLLIVIGQAWILHTLHVEPLILAFALPLCVTALLFALSAWLLRQPAAATPATPLAPAPPAAADVLVRCGKLENAQVLKEILREIKSVKEQVGVLDEQIHTIGGDMKAQRVFLQRRLRKLRAHQRRILDHLDPAEAPELENGQTLDLTRLFDEEQSALRHAQMRQRLAQVSKDDLNLLLEVVIELLERETEHAGAGDTATH